MRCFYHADREAVGTCKSCGRGLCRECAVEFPKGLACRGRCEADAEALIQLIDRNIQLSSKVPQARRTNKRNRSVAGIFYIIFGAIFTFWGVSDERVRLLTVAGIAFIGYGVYWLSTARSLGKDLES